MIEYLSSGKKYSLSYSELREKHIELCGLTTPEFMRRLLEAAHLACIIAWMKELPNDATIGDNGIIHELIHLQHLSGTDYEIRAVRKMFKAILRLD